MILSIDYGRKRIGLAISDETETIGTAIDPIIVKNTGQAIKNLIRIINENNINILIVGLPLGIDQKPTQMSQEIERFIKTLLENAKIKIEYWNETFTSEMAKLNGLNKKNIDSKSARIILQEYLDFKKNETNI